MTFKAHPFHLVAGLTAWAVYFIVVYGGMSVGCSFSDVSNSQRPWTWINAFVLLVTFIFMLGLLWAAWKCHQATPTEPRQPRFFLRLAAILYLLSAIATLLVGLPGAIYPPCL